MSTSTKAMSKPKRPLSGYNLFYRYKRNKVVEATAHPNVKHDDRRNEAVIRAVLAALPGLEDVPPSFPILDLPQARLDEFRAANIRKAMEGRLLPNENARNRLHCKVHGMGFVEMGRVMRQMWAQADKLTKDVFCELADVGRVRYRRLVAEYKLSSERPENVKSMSETPSYEVEKSAENTVLKPARTVNHSEEVAPAAAAVDPTTTKATAKAKASEASLIPEQAGSSSDPMLEALSVWATENAPVAGASSSESEKGARPSCRRRVSYDRHFQSPLPSEARSHGHGNGRLFESLAFKTTVNPTVNAASGAAEKSNRTSYERQASTAAGLDRCGDSLFEPLPVQSATGPAAIDPLQSNGHGRRVSTDIAPQLNWRAVMGNGGWTPKASSGHGRRVSTDVSPVLNGSMGAAGAPAAVAMGNGGAGSHPADANPKGSNLKLQQIVLRDAIKKMKDQIMQNNSLLPSDMRVYPKGGIVPQAQENNVGGKPPLEIVISSGPLIPSSHDIAHSNANPCGSGSTGAAGAPAAVAMGNGSAGSHPANANLESSNLKLQQIMLRNDIKKMKDQIMQNNSLLRSGMCVFPKGGIVPQAQENHVGGKTHLEIVTSSGPPVLSGRKREESARGSVEFVDELDAAIDDHGIAVGAMEDTKDRAAGIAGSCNGSIPSFVFVNPMFNAPGPNFGEKPVPPLQATVPMPAGVELKNHRASMA